VDHIGHDYSSNPATRRLHKVFIALNEPSHDWKKRLRDYSFMASSSTFHVTQVNGMIGSSSFILYLQLGSHSESRTTIARSLSVEGATPADRLPLEVSLP
jgi:hypothetical protein